MDPDETYRAYLLGTADTEMAARVEEELLDGRVSPDHLRQMEDELIDDLLFGRLSAEDEARFRAKVRSSAKLARKLEFARALQHHAAHAASAAVRPGLFSRMRERIAMPWVLPLAGALGCAILTVAWLGERNRSLHQELALVTAVNNDQKKTIASIFEDAKRREARSAVSTQVAGPRPAAVPPRDAASQAVLRLSPGVRRGVGHVAVLPLSRHASIATLALELPFEPTGTMHEELLNYDRTVTIWKQEFPVTGGIADHGLTTVAFPAGLVATGEYYLHVTAGADEASYQFRILKN